MATYYWIGTGTWDTTATANWAASSGGAGPAGPPTATDTVVFDAASGSGTCTLGANVSALIMNMTGSTITLAFGTNKISLGGNAATIFTGATTVTVTGTPLIECTYASGTGTRTLAPSASVEANSISFSITAGTDTVTTSGTNASIRNFNFSGFSGTLTMGSARQVFGDLTLSSGMTVQTSSATLLLRGRSSGTTTITTAGKTLDMAVTIGGSSTTSNIQLADNLTLGATRALTLSTGTFNANGNNVTIGSGGFIMTSGSVKTLTLGSGTWTCADGWDASGANSTVSASTATIKMTSASAKSFNGGGRSWPTLDQAGAGALTIAGSNTFANITSTYTATAACTITLAASTTQTVAAFGAAGASGKVLTINSATPGTRASIAGPLGTTSLSYVSLTDVAGVGAAIWRAYTTNGCTNGGNNGGFAFVPITNSAAFLS